jgi:hypothetical protein
LRLAVGFSVLSSWAMAQAQAIEREWSAVPTDV